MYFLNQVLHLNFSNSVHCSTNYQISIEVENLFFLICTCPLLLSSSSNLRTLFENIIKNLNLRKIEHLYHLQRSIFVCRYSHARNIQQYPTNRLESIPSIEGNKNWLNNPRTITPFFSLFIIIPL